MFTYEQKYKIEMITVLKQIKLNNIRSTVPN